MNKKCISTGAILILIFFIGIGVAQENQDFQSYKQEQASDLEQYAKDREEEFKEYREELENAFQEYKQSVSEVWGEDNAVVPSRKEWVQYRKDMRERNIVDFQNGRAKVQVALPAEMDTGKKRKKRLREAVLNTLNASADTRSIIEIAKNPDAPDKKGGESVLKGQVENEQGEEVTKENAEEFAEQVVEEKNIKTNRQKDEQGQERVIASVEFDLVPNHLEKRVKRFLPLVKDKAKKRNLDVPLVLALIETESYFNPTARSHVPAFGLMQLVPTSGGREAYSFVYGEDKAPEDDFLYQPEKNVELGTAYMYLVYNQHLDGVNDPQSRMWCTVAAYNTGSGNVLRTFAGKYTGSGYSSRKQWKQAALRKINSMEPQEVYRYLRRELPYKETRRYVKKIRNKRSHYSDS